MNEESDVQSSSEYVPRLLTKKGIVGYTSIHASMMKHCPWMMESTPRYRLDAHPDAVALWINEPEHAIYYIDHPDHKGQFASIVGVRRETRPHFRHRACIWGVYTRPALRHRGFGRASMVAAIELAKSWSGVARLDLGISSQSEAAVGLYISLGFEQWGVEPDCIRVDGQSFDEIRLSMKL
jgi:GNAT superfamily N-acetyltransferase